MKVTLLVLLVTCELCWTIRVPIVWSKSESEVKQDIINEDEPAETHQSESSRETFNSEDASSELKPQNEKPIPVEYFEYTAKKPQFAVDVAAFHGVQSPENHYKAYPIRPFTGTTKPDLGKHHLFDKGNSLQNHFQDFTKINNNLDHVNPVSSNYEIFHPYEDETPALQEIYKDPVLTQIRNDLENSKNRLQQYEKNAGEPNISSEEYLESPQKTDGKLFPHRHKPAPFEIHRPQRRPIYYKPVPVYKSREHFLNQKFKHPWNHNIAKVRPIHYRPIQNHIQKLRQNHALKYDDERNEYPQVQIFEKYSDPKDGYDIYEKGRDKYVQLRNNVDESINRAVKENRPAAYQKLEMQNNDSASDDDEDDAEEFVPIKNYAQVRKTETFRHLPKSAAFEDAETYDEIKNAPRLREAVKSTKAQTVYSEEGYEDAAYDHAGEQKHASENEGHGGFLKEYELSDGKYKTPSVSTNYEDGKGSVYKDQKLHAVKWKDDNKDTQEESVDEDFSENEHEHLLESDNHQVDSFDEEIHRNKRENNEMNDNLSSNVSLSNRTNDIRSENMLKKNNFQIPEIDLNSTFFKDKDYLLIKEKARNDTVKQKYPYYFKTLRLVSNNSPLRYAENLKLIPKKSKGGTEFYDSRSSFECPEIDDVPDPIPKKIKEKGQSDEYDEENSQEKPSTKDDNFDTTKKQPRLKGLGDKIDCFKAKYFGENPLDSPFFKESTIPNPEPAFLSNIAAYKLKTPILFNEKGENASEYTAKHVFDKLHKNNSSDLFDLIKKLRNDQNNFKSRLEESNNDFVTTSILSNNSGTNNSQLASQSSVYSDIMDNIKNSLSNVSKTQVQRIQDSVLTNHSVPTNKTYVSFQNKEDITKSPLSRKKRASPFVYEPYKIIRDGGQIQDDAKKNVASNNISPLIKHLQSSKVVDRVTKQSPQDIQHVKRNVNSRSYKDIGRKDREIKYGTSKNEKSTDESEIIDVSEDKRRGEPRYEIRQSNHKSKYTPVTHIKSMSKEDYDEQFHNENASNTQQNLSKLTKHKIPTNMQNKQAANYAIKSVLTTTSTLKPKIININSREKHQDAEDSDEDYEEYENDEEDDEKGIKLTTTTTTSPKPAFRRKIKPHTTTQEHHIITEEPKLKLVTRFRDHKPQNLYEKELKLEHNDQIKVLKPKRQETEVRDGTVAPQFREKKKKVSKSTIVTDTKRYGDSNDENDEILREEVDAMIGVKHDMDEYMPQYEKHVENKLKAKSSSDKNSEGRASTKYNMDSGNVDSEEDETKDNDDDKDRIIDDDDDVIGEYDDDDDDGDDDDDDNDDDDVDDESGDEIDNDDNEEDEYEENDGKDDKTFVNNEKQEKNKEHLKITTPEPTKRSLVITTDAPLPTIASRYAKIQEKPIVTRKKVEIHNELPVNKSSPHTTQFKQDIKEIEIIKETRNPLKRKPNKNVELLDFYKDDNLAKDINKLGVEIFKENLDLRKGPKHGGNYRSAEPSATELPTEEIQNIKDAEASQSEYKKQIEVDVQSKGELKSLKGRSKAKNSKLIELNDTPDRSMHGGNFKYRGRSRYNNPNSQKLIELDDHHNDDTSRDSHEDRSYKSSRRNERPMHGGNYRSEKLIQEKPNTSTTEASKSLPTEARRNAAQILNSFVQAVPVLTTTPGYILDPSKRMYYYLDV